MEIIDTSMREWHDASTLLAQSMENKVTQEEVFIRKFSELNLFGSAQLCMCLVDKKLIICNKTSGCVKCPRKTTPSLLGQVARHQSCKLGIVSSTLTGGITFFSFRSNIRMSFFISLVQKCLECLVSVLRGCVYIRTDLTSEKHPHISNTKTLKPPENSLKIRDGSGCTTLTKVLCPMKFLYKSRL